MGYKPLVSVSGIDTREYWKASDIWLKNPHVVNRRILSIKKLLFVETNLTVDYLDQTSLWIDRLADVSRLHEVHSTTPNQIDYLKALKLESQCTGGGTNLKLEDLSDNGSYLCLQILFPRNSEKFLQTLELVIVDKTNGRISFISNILDEANNKQSLSLRWPYRIEHDAESRTVSLQVYGDEDFCENSSVKWLKEQFFPRFVKWASVEDSIVGGLISGSLNLIPVEEYAILYNELKIKYGAEMVKVWPENTDPAKFVYEDVAIAAYLLILWKIERETKNLKDKQSFVDLGCGNGLLVHILTSEGHPGLGIDLRKRGIWDLYPKNTRLEVRTIVPSSSSLFPEADWLIGNHSDELTPWIPVIAARSSYRCRFFLLPCCAYEFDGRKYQRENAEKSQYFEYMNYVKKICEECGFETDMDKLRIPSTKRICLVGRERTYSEENTEIREAAIRSLIEARSEHSCKKNSDDSWSAGFKPREAVEKVRNCTKVDRALISEVISLVSENLLSKRRLIEVPGSEEKWNAGGQIELSEIARLLPQDTLKGMKSECGGLQTLLRNNGDIFQIVDGKVQFRIPGAGIGATRKKKQRNKKLTIKSKPCWFYLNHPNGCPLNDETCNYNH